MLRVGELLQREFSAILRKRYQSESVTITITEIRVAPDLHDAKVFVSIMGDEAEVEAKLRWLRAHCRAIREELGRVVVLKFMPRFEFVTDHSTERANRVLGILDSLPPPSVSPEAPPPAP